MSATRFDTIPWISGATVFGVGGFGVLAETIPATGANGPAYAYRCLDFPADTGKEICGRITTEPSAGTFDRSEDTSFAFTAPDGSYEARFQLYVDGVPTGLARVDLVVGEGLPRSVVYGLPLKRQREQDDEEMAEVIQLLSVVL